MYWPGLLTKTNSVNKNVNVSIYKRKPSQTPVIVFITIIVVTSFNAKIPKIKGLWC